jgi:hypothetical protein
MPVGFLDHINGDKLDNRIANLRLSTNAENSRNRPATRRNSTGYKGVYLDSYTGRWKAQINVDGKNRNLGRFDTPEEAHAAYREAAEQWHGAFARTE